MTTAAASRDPEASSSQAPLLVPWQQRLLGRFHVTGVFWYRLHFWALRHWPRRLLAPTLWLFACFFWLALPGIRRALGNNLEWVLGGYRRSWLERQWRALRTIHQHAWCLTETYEGLCDGPPVAPNVEIEGGEHWQRLNQRSGGFVLVTAHVGHWEVGSRLRTPERARRVHVVRAPEINAEAQRFLAELLRSKSGDHVEVHFTRAEDPALGARLIAALRAGEVVALQGDRSRSGQRSAPARLFGQAIALPVGAAALARAADVPLLPVFVFRRGRARSTVSFRPPIAVPRTAHREEDWQIAVTAIAREVEWAIARRPHQWFCFRDLWGRPPRSATVVHRPATPGEERG